MSFQTAKSIQHRGLNWIAVQNNSAPALTYIYLDCDTALGFAKLADNSDASILYPTGSVVFVGASQNTLNPPPPLNPGPSVNPLFPGSVYAARAGLGVGWTITLGGAFDNAFIKCRFDFICNSQIARVEFFDSIGSSIGFADYPTGTNSLWLYNQEVNCGSTIHSIVVSGSPASWPALDNIRFYTT